MGTSAKRRSILKGSLSIGALGILGPGLLIPERTLAAWQKDAFRARQVSAALEALTGHDAIVQDDDRISIETADSAESGMAVRVRVSTDLPDVKSIIILVPDKPTPLVASFDMGPEMEGHVATRIKMDTSGELLAVIQSVDNLFSARKQVKVLPGGNEGQTPTTRRSIEIRAKLRDGITRVNALITHPMEPGTRRSARSDEPIPPHFIQEVTCDYGDSRLLTAQWSSSISRDPYLSFSFRGGNKGGMVKLGWADNRGNSDFAKTEVK